MEVKNFPKKWQSILISKTNFQYNGKEKTSHRELSNLNLKIPRNAKIGLVGLSGSGKSTLAKLLTGIYGNLDNTKLAVLIFMN